MRQELSQLFSAMLNDELAVNEDYLLNLDQALVVETQAASTPSERRRNREIRDVLDVMIRWLARSPDATPTRIAKEFQETLAFHLKWGPHGPGGAGERRSVKIVVDGKDDRATTTLGVVAVHTQLSERRTTLTPTPTTTTTGSPPGAAVARIQTVEIPTGGAAGPRQPMRVGDCLDREVVSPTRRVSVGTQEKSERDRGESAASTADEVKTTQLDVTSHGCEGGPAIEGPTGVVFRKVHSP